MKIKKSNDNIVDAANLLRHRLWTPRGVGRIFPGHHNRGDHKNNERVVIRIWCYPLSTAATSRTSGCCVVWLIDAHFFFCWRNFHHFPSRRESKWILIVVNFPVWHLHKAMPFWSCHVVSLAKSLPKRCNLAGLVGALLQSEFIWWSKSKGELERIREFGPFSVLIYEYCVQLITNISNWLSSFYLD